MGEVPHCTFEDALAGQGRLAIRLLAVTLVILGFSARPLVSKVAAVGLSDIVASSELIGIGQVVAVKRSFSGKRIATVEFEEHWKGVATSARVEISRTWFCDVSEATVGERAAIFLVPKGRRGRYVFALAGRGRLSIRSTENGLVADFWPEIVLPEESETSEGPDPRASWVRSVKVETLRQLVELNIQRP